MIPGITAGGVSAGGGGGDPYWANVSLLMHMDGSDGSTTFTDSSPEGHTVVANGDAKITTAQSRFGSASGAFNASLSSYLSAPDDASLVFGTGDYTVEGFARFNSVNAFRRIFSTTTGAFAPECLIVRLTSTSRIFAYGGDGSGLTSTTVITTDAWYHIAVTREGSTLRLFVNGVLEASETITSDTTQALRFFGGYYTVGSAEFMSGWMDEVRVTKGVARYTADFTPPDAPFPDS